jgi:glyoxylase-like metal-dependent hydrolase (beta-lactamase superfamily II)
MKPQELLPGLFAFSTRHYVIDVNLFWIVNDDGQTVTLIDTGFPGNADAILKAIAPRTISTILVTHAHQDHAGSLAALKASTKATISMHPEDARYVAEGNCRPLKVPSPTLVSRLVFWLLIRQGRPRHVEAVDVDHKILDGEELPIAGGIRAIHAPGHSEGQLAFLWNKHGGVLFAADAAAKISGLNLSIGYEDLERGRQTLAKLAALDFDNACFGHGPAILGGADKAFRRKWPPKRSESQG